MIDSEKILKEMVLSCIGHEEFSGWEVILAEIITEKQAESHCFSCGNIQMKV